MALLNDNQIEESSLTIEFHDSLRLLSVQDCLSLLKVCKNNRKCKIKLPGIDGPAKTRCDRSTLNSISGVGTYDQETTHNNNNFAIINWEKAVTTSQENNTDVRLLKHGRNEHGMPIIMDFAYLEFSEVEQEYHEIIINDLINQDLDINLTDTVTGESLVFPLIRKQYINSLMHLLGNNLKESKKIYVNLNYYNKVGQSPLYVALYQRVNRIGTARDQIRERSKNIYKYLLDYGASKFDSIIAGNKITSPLGFALQQEMPDFQVKMLCRFGPRQSESFSCLFVVSFVISFVISFFLAVLVFVDPAFFAFLFEQLIDDLMDRGCLLNTREIAELAFLYVKHGENDAMIARLRKTENEWIVNQDKSNPLHLCMSTMTRKDSCQKIISLKQVYPEWALQTNKTGDIPAVTALKLRKIHEFKAIVFGQLDPASNNDKHKNLILSRIKENENDVLLIIDWVTDLVDAILDPYLVKSGKIKIVRDDNGNGIESNTIYNYVKYTSAVQHSLATLGILMRFIQNRDFCYVDTYEHENETENKNQNDIDENKSETLQSSLSTPTIFQQCRLNDKLYIVQFLQKFFHFGLSDVTLQVEVKWCWIYDMPDKLLPNK